MGQFLSNLFPPPPKELRLKDVISRGEYREVSRGTSGRRPVAVKKFSDLLLSTITEHRNERELEASTTAFRREHEVLKRAKNPYIVEYLGAYKGIGREGGALLVMEWMYQTLKMFLKANKGNLPRQKKMDICYQVGLFVFIHGQLSCFKLRIGIDFQRVTNRFSVQPRVYRILRSVALVDVRIFFTSDWSSEVFLVHSTSYRVKWGNLEQGL